MKLAKRIFSVALIAVALSGLQACSDLSQSDNTNYNGDYTNANNVSNRDLTLPLTGDERNNAQSRSAIYQSMAWKRPIATISPAAEKNRDGNWAHEQKADEYTIQLANDEKPASVAQVLLKTPKLHRTAQLRRTQDGKTVYTGVYGSYKNREQAEAALQKLPADVRANAGVVEWNKVQGDAKDKAPAQATTTTTVTTVSGTTGPVISGSSTTVPSVK